MPYEIKRDSRCPKSKPFGVMKKGDGEMHGCHASRAAARKQMAALYVAESKKEAIEELEEKAIDGTDAGVEVKETHEKMMDMPRYVPYGVTSFEELRTAREADEATLEMNSLAGDLQGLLGNRISEIMVDEETDDKAAAIIISLKELAEELVERMQAEADVAGEEEKEVPPSDGGMEPVPAGSRGKEEDETTLFERFKEWLGKTVKPADDKKSVEPSQGLGFMVWKEADGSYRWMARYSNNFRDQDNPPEIISAQSHRRFDELLSKGQALMPELWLWHRPEWKWGTTTWHAYDDSGFALAAGVVNKGAEPLAEHLMALDPALVRVSHGMPTNSIARDADDPSVIVEHITREISPLPAWAAANKLTGFIILKEATDMTIPEEKRATLQAQWNLSDELLTQLEAANVATAKEEVEAGTEQKEVETTEATPAVPVSTGMEPEVTETTPPEEPGVSREEMREALLAIGRAIATLGEQVKEIQGQVVEVKEQRTVEEAATLSEIFQRAIGHPDARLDGRTTAAKDRPAETPVEKPGVVNTGNLLADQVVNSIVNGNFLESLRGLQQPQ